MENQNESLHEEEQKCCGTEDKQPYFEWNESLIAEFAHEVAIEYSQSEIWSGDDLGAEKGLIKHFIKRKKFEELYKDLIISEAGPTIIVNKDKFDKLISFLYNYREDYR